MKEDMGQKVDRLEEELRNGPKMGGLVEQLLHSVVVPQIRQAAKTDADKVKDGVRHIVKTLTDIFEL